MKASWNWPRRYWVVHVLLLICYYLPLEKGCSPSFKQTWIPFLYQVWWNWSSGSRENFIKSSRYLKYYFAFISYWKRANCHLTMIRLEFPSPKDDLCQVWIGQVVLGKMSKMWNVYWRKGLTTEKALSSCQLRWAIKKFVIMISFCPEMRMTVYTYEHQFYHMTIY